MDFKKFNEVAELVGIVAIVASLVFVGLQMQQSQRIALAEIEATRASTAIEMASLISDNAEVWARGIADEELDHSEAVIFRNIVSTFAEKNYAMQKQFRLLGNDPFADDVVHKFAAYLHDRPGARRGWTEHEASLKNSRGLLNPSANEVVSEYVETIMKDFAELDRIEN